MASGGKCDMMCDYFVGIVVALAWLLVAALVAIMEEHLH